MITIILAFTTLVGVFLLFRIERVTDILIGDGKSVLDRQKEGLDGKNPNEPIVGRKYWARLRDAIYRKNIYGIEEGIRRISIREIKIHENPGTTGYSRHALKKFLKTKKMLLTLKFLLVSVFLMSLLTILVNLIVNGKLISLNLISDCTMWVLNILQIIFVILYFCLIIFSVIYSLYFRTPHELEKIKECRSLKI